MFLSVKIELYIYIYFGVLKNLASIVPKMSLLFFENTLKKNKYECHA